jgi:hypothetical protein
MVALAATVLVWGLLPGASSTASAATTSLSLTTSTSTATAGTPFPVTVTALDENGATDPTYTGTVHFATNDESPEVVLPKDSQLTNGQGTFEITLINAGSWPTITVSDAAASMSTTLKLTVNSAEADHLVLVLRTGPMASYGFSFIVVVQDRYANQANPYAGTVHFTTSDTSPGVVLPPDSTICCGQRYFSAALNKAGPQTVTATDTATSSITGTMTVNVRPGPTASIRLDVPATAVMGAPFDLTLTLLDRVGNVATGVAVPYTGTIHFTSSDSLATLPTDYTFQQSYYTADSGIRTFTATLMTPGDQTVTATDTVNASITGTSPSIQVLLPLVGVGLPRP